MAKLPEYATKKEFNEFKKEIVRMVKTIIATIKTEKVIAKAKIKEAKKKN